MFDNRSNAVLIRQRSSRYTPSIVYSSDVNSGTGISEKAAISGYMMCFILQIPAGVERLEWFMCAPFQITQSYTIAYRVNHPYEMRIVSDNSRTYRMETRIFARDGLGHGTYA